MTLTNPPPLDHATSPLPEMAHAGKLPNRRPDSLWAGRSGGDACALCERPLKLEELEYELEYARSGPEFGVDSYHVHIRCFGVFIWKVTDPGNPRRGPAS
jgi:hypothetical protein